MEVRLNDPEDPRGYKTWEEVEADIDATEQLEKNRKNGLFGLIWKLYYGLRELYYIVFYRFSPSYEVKKLYWFFQRGFRGWASCDTWSFSGYIARVIKGGIKYLRDKKQGIPAEFFPEGMTHPEVEKVAEERWTVVLDEIIWSFDMADRVNNSDVHMYIESWTEEKNIEMANSLKELAHKKGYEPDHYMTKAEYERMQNGFQLFIKHFWSLWS
jgi:hypothetical protein